MKSLDMLVPMISNLRLLSSGGDSALSGVMSNNMGVLMSRSTIAGAGRGAAEGGTWICFVLGNATISDREESSEKRETLWDEYCL